VVLEILKGAPPQDLRSVTDIDKPEMRLVLGPTSSWITNGILSDIFRCWDSRLKKRITAIEFQQKLDDLPNQDTNEWAPSKGMVDLTGSVQTPGGRSRPILGWSVGTWRLVFKM
jgi:hypothetical protein